MFYQALAQTLTAMHKTSNYDQCEMWILENIRKPFTCSNFKVAGPILAEVGTTHPWVTKRTFKFFK
jgi:hypothetical protein